MTYAKTQRGTHAHRTHSHTSYFTLEYIICIKHCSSFVKDENEYINYAQKGIIGYVYVTVSVCVRARIVYTDLYLCVLFHLLVALIQFKFVCVMCTGIQKHTNTNENAHL